MQKSKGLLESEISKALTQWEKDFLGRGSVNVKTDIVRDMIVVTLRGVLTPAEYALCETKDGMLTVKRTRSDLVESGIDKLKEIIFDLTNQEVKNFHTDISTNNGERVMIFRLQNNYEKQLKS
ncbi:DUF2294 domain-containing protein [Aquibacillus sediminis]|uniref:DUF2294 domain-containing protein n=1 Tax=Aquibacillus sediminis TaxID=2574734 RepID=UPI001109AD29|nr:DUF2294 domain-containing protein [Aquibacillus sediminis]